MTYNQILKHYGGLSEASQGLEFSKQRIQHWRKNRIPSDVQIQIAKRSGLKPDREAQEYAARMAAYVNGGLKVPA